MRVFSSLAPAALLLSVAAIAAAQPPRAAVHPAPLEDPGGQALARFHAALRRAAAGESRARVSVFGASHTASDQFPGELRRRWQRTYGDAGPGWVPLTPPHAYYRHEQVVVESGHGLSVARVRGARPRGDYGASGWAWVAGSNARANLHLSAAAASVDRALVFGPTRGLRARDGERELAIGPGAVVGPLHSLSLRPPTGARFTGLSLERDAPGVIVDSIGVPGSRLRDRSAWDRASLRASLARLAPDLIVLAYGTNEAGIARRSRRIYRAEVDAALEQLPAAGDVSCVLLGPSDWPQRHGDSFRARARVADVIAVQRAAAFAHGCAFLDLQALTGGALSMLDWERDGLAVGDHVHFSDAGHARIGAALHGALSP